MKAKTSVVSLFTLLLALGGFLAEGAMAADPRNGAKLYNIHCSSCHGPRGQGAMPGMPDFSRGQRLFVANAALVKVIENGSGVMPAYRGLLSTQDILDVIAHLRTFQ